jgi:hypothetical protein
MDVISVMFSFSIEGLDEGQCSAVSRFPKQEIYKSLLLFRFDHGILFLDVLFLDCGRAFKTWLPS